LVVPAVILFVAELVSPVEHAVSSANCHAAVPKPQTPLMKAHKLVTMLEPQRPPPETAPWEQ